MLCKELASDQFQQKNINLIFKEFVFKIVNQQLPEKR